MKPDLSVVKLEPRARQLRVNEDLVALLRKYLALAEGGEIVCMGAAVVYADGCTGTGVSSDGLNIELHSAAAMLSYRISRLMDDDAGYEAS